MFVIYKLLSFPVTFVTRLARRVPLVEQELDYNRNYLFVSLNVRTLILHFNWDYLLDFNQIF